MSSVRTFVLILGVAALAGTGVYLVQQTRLERVRAQYQALVVREARLVAERDAAANSARSTKLELAGLQANQAELERLRSEISQVRRERDELKQRLSRIPTPAVAAKTDIEPRPYITSGQLAFAGYATPEDALESMTWSMMNGDYDQSLASLGPELQQEELAKDRGREEFEARRQVQAPLFKGMQILASKMLADDTVELKVRVDALPSPDATTELPLLVIQPMVKVGDEWKLGNPERAFDEGWDQPEPAPPKGR